MSSVGEGVKPSLYQPAPSDMSRIVPEKSWEELRRDSRQLENEIDAKLNSFSKLSSNYLQSSSDGGGGGQMTNNSGHLYETISIEIEQLLARLRSVNEQMNHCMSRGQGGMATPTAALHHTLQRHNEILQDYMQEYNRTKNVIISQRQREELLGPRKTDGYKSSSALNRRTELYLKEHEHIRGSDALADEAISIAMTTKENLSHQRGAFSNITSRMQSVTLNQDRFPLINSVVQKINLRKRRDSLIVGAVIAVCLIILLYLIVR